MRPLTGRVIGAHQKIDRLARIVLRPYLKINSEFPATKLILHFEGINGPDAIKRKSPSKDEPWHYYDPFDETDSSLVKIIDHHYKHLVLSLRKQDDVRAAFEAAWLAHAIVDGLTPAHHFPYEEKLAEIREGEGRETRTTLKHKLVMPGQTRGDQIKNNWKMWGPRGLLTTHGGFELGVATILAPISSEKRFAFTKSDLAELDELGLEGFFRLKAKEVAALGLFESYISHGWTPLLADRVSRRLLPAIIKPVSLAWYSAAREAGLTK